MQQVISAFEMREIDRLTTERFATPSLLLMEAAANASARAIAARFGNDLSGKRVRIFCGRGNNGGDGAALARVLSQMGAHIDILLVGRVDETKGDARVNFDMLRQLASYEAGSPTRPSPLLLVECVDVETWEKHAAPRASYDIRVDALFGTGLSRPLEGVPLQIIEHLELLRQAREHAGSDVPLIVSLDIPSGLDADSAEPIGDAVHADLTVTFSAPKPANVLPPASQFNGELVIADIGSPPALFDAVESKLFLTEQSDVKDWLIKTRYSPDSYKYSHGHALIVAGSRGYTGAAALAGDAAICAGAGLVTVATPISAQQAVAVRTMPEVMTAALAETDRGAVSENALDHVSRLLERATVIAVGPGLTYDDERTRRFVHEIISRRRTPVVIDADGLNALSPWPKGLRGTIEYPLILTPHSGEMLRMLGTDDKNALKDRVSAVRQFAIDHAVIVVLKGTRTLVAAADGNVYINPTGNAGLGTAGAGDTLTGIISGFIAQACATLKDDADLVEATIAAVYIGGLAGDLAAGRIGMRGMVASDSRLHLSEAFLLIDEKGERP